MKNDRTICEEFQKELQKLINKYSLEKESTTPDFVLATYLTNCLDAWNIAVQQRTDWWESLG